MSLIPGSSMKTNAAMRKRTITGPGGPRELELRRAVDLRASSKRARFWRRYFQMNAISNPSTRTKIATTKIETKSQLSRIPRRSATRAPRELGEAGAQRQREGERGDAHRLPFYERARGPVSGNARTPSRGRRATVRRVRERGRAGGGTDFRIEGRTLVFDRELKTEGKLGFWRWLSLWVGIAGLSPERLGRRRVPRNGKPVVAARLHPRAARGGEAGSARGGATTPLAEPGRRRRTARQCATADRAPVALGTTSSRSSRPSAGAPRDSSRAARVRVLQPPRGWRGSNHARARLDLGRSPGTAADARRRASCGPLECRPEARREKPGRW